MSDDISNLYQYKYHQGQRHLRTLPGKGVLQVTRVTSVKARSVPMSVSDRVWAIYVFQRYSGSSRTLLVPPSECSRSLPIGTRGMAGWCGAHFPTQCLALDWGRPSGLCRECGSCTRIEGLCVQQPARTHHLQLGTACGSGGQGTDDRSERVAPSCWKLRCKGELSFPCFDKECNLGVRKASPIQLGSELTGKPYLNCRFCISKIFDRSNCPSDPA